MKFPFNKKKQDPPSYDEPDEQPKKKSPFGDKKANPFGKAKPKPGASEEELVEDTEKPFKLACPGCGMHLELKAAEESEPDGDESDDEFSFGDD